MLIHFAKILSMSGIAWEWRICVRKEMLLKIFAGEEKRFKIQGEKIKLRKKCCCDWKFRRQELSTFFEKWCIASTDLVRTTETTLFQQLSMFIGELVYLYVMDGSDGRAFSWFSISAPNFYLTAFLRNTIQPDKKAKCFSVSVPIYFVYGALTHALDYYLATYL